MNFHPTQFLFLFAVALLPIGYVVLCGWMFRRHVWWFTYVAYFFLFGSLGGWCLTIMFPPGPIPLLGSAVLYFGGAVACLGSSVALNLRKAKSRFEVAAMRLGYLYFIVLAFLGLANVGNMLLRR